MTGWDKQASMIPIVEASEVATGILGGTKDFAPFSERRLSTIL